MSDGFGTTIVRAWPEGVRELAAGEMFGPSISGGGCVFFGAAAPAAARRARDEGKTGPEIMRAAAAATAASLLVHVVSSNANAMEAPK